MADIHPLLAQLRAARMAAGFASIGHAANRLGVDQSVLGSYERGDRNPSAQRLDEVYPAFGRRLAVIPADLDDAELDQALRLWAAHKTAVAAYPCGTCGEPPTVPSSEGNGFGYRCACGSTFANPSAMLGPQLHRLAEVA